MHLTQYMARIRPRYSLGGLHIRITWLSSKTKWLFSVIALTMLRCIVNPSFTMGALVCVVVTVHSWRRRTHYDVTEACHELHNILTVHLDNGETRAGLKGNSKQCEVRAKAGRQCMRHVCGRFDAIFFINRYGTNPYSYFGFLWARSSPWNIEQRLGASAIGLYLTGDVSSLGSDVLQVWLNSQFVIKSPDFPFQDIGSVTTIFVSTSYMYVQDKTNTLLLRNTVRQTSLGK